MRHRDRFHNKQNTQKMVARSSGKPVTHTGQGSRSTPYVPFNPILKFSNIETSNIVPSNIVTLIKFFRLQKRAITYGNFETRFSKPIVIISIKRIKWTLVHI